MILVRPNHGGCMKEEQQTSSQEWKSSRVWTGWASGGSWPRSVCHPSKGAQLPGLESGQGSEPAGALLKIHMKITLLQSTFTAISYEQCAFQQYWTEVCWMCVPASSSSRAASSPRSKRSLRMKVSEMSCSGSSRAPCWPWIAMPSVLAFRTFSLCSALFGWKKKKVCG